MSRKLINAPEAIIPEMIDGFVAAWPDLLRVAGETKRALVAVDGPRYGKVGVVIGGGSGHEPAFAGYVGRGLADAAAVGNVFASPSPAQIADAGRAADGGAGVAMLFGNYTGDVMNFDMAREILSGEGIPCQCFAVTDDVVSAPADRKKERRGIAGGFFVYKIAGAAADAGRDLDGVLQAAQAANEATRSMGVALSACSMPQTAVPNFEIPDGQMEVGMGLHGEPGIERVDMETADQVADRLMKPLVEDLSLQSGDRVAALMNGLGATSQLELLILWHRVARQLAARGIEVVHRWVGEYATSLEMAGTSLTLMRLDEGLQDLLERPCHTPALTVGTLLATERPVLRRKKENREKQDEVQKIDVSMLVRGGAVTPAVLCQMISAAAARMRRDRDMLSQLDGAIGDGDHGVTMEIGWNAAEAAVVPLHDGTPPQVICAKAAAAILDAVGASSGPLWFTALTRAGQAVSDRMDLDGPALARWLEGAQDGLRARGGAKCGDKTMIDAWDPAVKAALNATKLGRSEAAVLRESAKAAFHGAESTKSMLAARGRAAKLGERVLGHADPGAVSTAAILDAMASVLEDQGV